MRSRLALPAILVLALVMAGCTGAPADGSTATATATTDTPTATPPDTSPPSGDIDFPDGPKERPDRPSTLNESAVREYVRTYEYRYAYNSLWMNEYTDVTLDCRVDDVSRREWGYEAVVTCTGYSNTRAPENATVTAGPHADWFTQSFRYRVSEEATERVRVENRDPV
ncbi:hypothetical protein [Haloplanus aerogenes]|uniref:Lipoprotein n=1 Tax=Haloplanus aerogenes TaxID=660522 RepID=A0A3M0DSK8_9EURY|nr:hypothetical protein [Haloplanus aerogenes]AZH25466.1 hypothetical protein DU502_08770 [Haloplanus aerogenes]RMB25178.1 hypothetical protein ATH50_0262 [Haloplanus aerogenes]